MYNEITHWITRQVQWYVNGGPSEGGPESNNQEREIPRMPVLPSQRAHQLNTPPEMGDIGAATTNSTFFARLPSDVRRLILIEAFGDRIMHMDFRFGYDPSLLPTLSGCANCEVSINADHGLSGHHRDKGRGWEWYGCVCHRDPEWRVRNRRIGNNCVSEPKRDACLSSDSPVGSRACASWSGEELLKCHVGAMGWLRTCRQA